MMSYEYIHSNSLLIGCTANHFDCLSVYVMENKFGKAKDVGEFYYYCCFIIEIYEFIFLH